MELNTITIGTLIAVIITTEKIISWIWNKFNQAYKLKKNADSFINMVDKHTAEINDIKNDLNNITKLINKQGEFYKQSTVASFRTKLWRMHRDLTNQKYMTESDYKTWRELGELYEQAGGNDIFHDKLNPEVLDLPMR